MNICVLQPSYEGSTFDYQHYDPPRDLSPLLPAHTVCHAFLKKIATFRQLRDLKKQGFDIYVNLCEGYLDSDIPSIDVIMALEHLNMPYTGPTLTLYDPPKNLMKLVAHAQGVSFRRARQMVCRDVALELRPRVDGAPDSDVRRIAGDGLADLE